MGAVRPDYLDTLSEAFQERRSKNHRYSLRAFARSLGLSSSLLSCILRRKRVPSLKLSDSISKKLNLPKNRRAVFLESVAEALKEESLSRIDSRLEPKNPRLLTEDEFKSISDWFHYVILELTETQAFRLDPEWIAKELEIPKRHASTAIKRLQALRLIEKNSGDVWKKVNRPVSTLDKAKTSVLHRRRQKQILRRAILALDHVPIESRSMTSMTMAICPENLPQAKELILNFNRKLCRLLQDGSKTEVYELGICLYPHQKIGKRKGVHKP